MMERQSFCIQGVTLTTLSAWRDQELTAGDASTLAAHVPTCRFCQATLAEFATVTTALEGQRLPLPDARLWRGVRDGIAQRDRPAKPPIIRRAALVSGGAFAALILVLAIVLLRPHTPEKPPVSVAATATLTPTIESGSPTATETPNVQKGRTAPATWSIGTLPAGFGYNDMGGTTPQTTAFQVSGATAYVCVGSYNTANHLVISHDQGQHWTAAAPLPAGVTKCNDLVVATNDPTVIILDGGLQDTSYFSSDSGLTWQQTGMADIQAVTTFNGAIYAILTDPSITRSALALAATLPSDKGAGSHLPLTVNHSCPCSYPSLVVSHDHLKTWQSIDAGVLPGDAAKSVQQFWLNPVTGSLLVQEFMGTGWLSDDGGQHWRQLSFPSAKLAFRNFAVQVPTSAQPWRLCVSNYCSADSGTSWRPVPPGTTPFAIGTDGTIYAAPVENPPGIQLYVLPPSATQWQLPAPAHFSLPSNVFMNLRYSPATTGDILWMFLGGGQDQPAITPPYVTIAFT